jgi:hypothetical protein
MSLANLHHAHLLVGSKANADTYVAKWLSEQGMAVVGNPDFSRLDLQTFGIPEARELTVWTARRSFSGRKVFLISAEKITLEAQNALLKTFEEPIADTHFFLVVHEEDQLIPTLRSRMQIVRLSGVESAEEGNLSASHFLGLTPSERIDFAKKFADEEKSLPVFLDQLLLILRRSGASQDALRGVWNVRRFASDRSAGSRLMLEHLALTL